MDGAWYRCCGGKVRKLTDCCSYSSRRINGDAALTGYCYRGRKVFCVMYYDTQVPVLIGAIEVSLAAAALLIGATGTFSPCGFSVVETLGPDRAHRRPAHHDRRLHRLRPRARSLGGVHHLRRAGAGGRGAPRGRRPGRLLRRRRDRGGRRRARGRGRQDRPADPPPAPRALAPA